MREHMPLDTSFLPSADFEFVVMTDTHYMLDPGPQRIEFESRRHQSARAQYAFAQIASLDCEFIVHLGDLVQEFPDGPNFEKSLNQALQQIQDAGVSLRQVAGNHDVGDKPDPTMPTDWVSAATLEAFHARFGPSWNSWDAGGCHFVILNSQIMNGPLPAARQQHLWLEEDLAAHTEVPTFIFQHLSPYLVDEAEPGLGHYDNIEQPARGWLVDLIRAHNVQLVFSGHSHFAFFNRIGNARSYLAPSTAFTRPGFCEVFSSAPPPERGRDDAPKLGFFLVRLHDGIGRVHFIRTSGATTTRAEEKSSRQMVSCVTADLPHSPLGVTLRHPLTSTTEVPIAWQSTVRQPVRNDFPLLACLELGVRHIRATASDLVNETQREQLEAIRDEGVSITATWIWSSRAGVVAEIARHRRLLDGVELQLPNALVPDDECLAAIAHIVDELSLPVSLAPLLPHEHVEGKQHARTRIGYHPSELETLDRFLDARGTQIDRVLCRLDANQSPKEEMRITDALKSSKCIGAVDWAVEFIDGNPALQTPRATGALAEIAAHPGSRLFLEPLIDLDRTMDAPPGLLDRLCNPRRVFHALRTMNSVLFGKSGAWTHADDLDIEGARVVSLDRAGQRILVLLPDSDATTPVKALTLDTSVWPGSKCESLRVISMESGVISRIDALGRAQALLPSTPTLIVAETASQA